MNLKALITTGTLFLVLIAAQAGFAQDVSTESDDPAAQSGEDSGSEASPPHGGIELEAPPPFPPEVTGEKRKEAREIGPEDTEVPGGVDEEPEEGLVDGSHRKMSEQLKRFSNGIDRFFVNENFDETLNHSYIRIGPGVSIGRVGETKFKPRLKVNFDIPNTERRVGLVISGNSGDDSDNDFNRSSGDDQNVSTSLRVLLFDNRFVSMQIDGGSRFRPEPDPFAQLRFQRVDRLWKFLVRPTQFVYWEFIEGLGETSRLDIDYQTSHRSLLRLRSEADYGESTSGFEFDSSLFFYLVMRERSAWEFRMRIKAETKPRSVVTEYRPSAKYRWSAFRPWLFFEFEPAVRFEREFNYRPYGQFLIRVEVVFGDVVKGNPLRGAIPD